MVYNVEVIMQDVRIALDENKISDQLINDEDIDTLSLNEIIHSKIVEAVRRVENSAPLQFLEERHHFGDAVFWADKGSGWVLLPDDFMRLIAFRMSDWERTCYSAISVNDPLYELQSSRHKGIRGNKQKPICAIVLRAEGRALEFFSSNSTSAKVIRASYLPYPKINEGKIEISERCYSAVVYTIAALSLMAIGTFDKAAQMNALAKSFFE